MPSITEVSERFQRATHSVCRVKIGGNTAGSGFLVGPDTVLTNYHVVQDALGVDGQFKSAISCVFDDVRMLDGGRKDGYEVKADSRCVDWSPYGAAEITASPNDPMPSIDELDYAVLKLKEAVGSNSLNGDPRSKRGWIDLFDAVPAMKANAPVIVMQHPFGSAQFYHASNYSDANELETRFRYNMVEAQGSSGSPSFTGDFRIFALHHMGDSNWLPVHPAQGVPIVLIRDRIMAKSPTAVARYDVTLQDSTQTPWDVMFTVIRQSPEARKQVSDSKEIVKAVDSHNRRLERVKTIHDVLQDIQFSFSDMRAKIQNANAENAGGPMRDAGRLMSRYWQSRSAILADTIASLSDIELGEWDWTAKFGEEIEKLNELKENDTLTGFEAIAAILPILKEQPLFLNKEIVSTLKRLPIQKLLDVFSAISATLPGGSIRDLFDVAPAELRALWTSVSLKVNEHNVWQGIENDILSLEEKKKFNDSWDELIFVATWNKLWIKVQALCSAAPGADWSKKLQIAGGAIASLIKAKSWDASRENLQRFHDDVTRCFRRVDQTLIAESRKMVAAGDPLTNLVRAAL